MRSMIALAVVLYDAKPASEADQIAYATQPQAFAFSMTKESKGKVTIGGSVKLPGREEDWHRVLQDFPSTSISGRDPVLIGRRVLARAINRWLGITGVRPIFSWHNDFSFVLQGGTGPFLLPRLTVQLMLEVSRSPDWALCRCTRVFLLRKGQSKSRRTYCEKCSGKVSQSEANKRFRIAERENPDRNKRKRLTWKERKDIIRDLKQNRKGRRPIGFIPMLAKRYGVSASAIYKIDEGCDKEKDK